MLTKPLFQGQMPVSLTAKQKLVLTLLVTLLFSTLWLGLERVRSAAAEVASPPPAPLPPIVTLMDVPPEVLIGEEFKFKVKFESVTGSPFGYGPSLDLVLEEGGANSAKSAACLCDGITFVKAEILDVIGGPTDVTPPASAQISTSPCSSNSNINVQHPFGSFATSGIQPLTLPPGARLVTIELPFGSFTPAQPSIVVEITAKVSNLADYNHPLKISARGGFRYGGDPQDNPSTDLPIFSDTNSNSSQWTAQAQTTPNVLIINKAYLGPEDETATGPNFPHDYAITVDIADGQTVANLSVQDFLPNNMQYQSLVGVIIHTTLAVQGTNYVLTQPSGVGGTLTVKFLTPIVGAQLPPDVTITFRFFIPEVDKNGFPILPNCKPATSKNDIKAEGDWTPQDSCDQSPLHVVSDVKAIDHSLADKCLAIQKKVTTFNPAGPKPGDLLMYDLQFEVSDYKTIGNLMVRDFLADGQILAGPPPIITISDQFATRANIFPPVALTNTPAPAGAAQYCPPPLQAPLGGRLLTFNVSQAMGTLAATPRWNAGILTGGFAAGPGIPNGPATATIRFFARITDAFQFPVPAGHNQFVDKDDPINNCVNIQGKVFKNITGPSPLHARNIVPTLGIGKAQDGSATHLTIVTDKPVKSVYAVKRGGLFICGPGGSGPCSNFPNPPQEVRPGDEVTFRIEKIIPSSDAEQLTIQDWFALPTFNIAGISFNNAVCGIPSSNSGCLLPTDTLSTWVTPQPGFSFNPATNSITFDYHDFHDINNQPRKIDIIVTETVTSQPSADGLFLTNVVQECENDSFSNVPHCQTTIAQVKVREPKLQIKKGVVATDNPHGVFTPALSPTGVWQPSGSSCPDFHNGPITSATLGGLINSNLSNVDANDTVTFGIAIENTGGAPACEIELADIIPLDQLDKPSCFDADFSSLCITDGSGVQIPFTTAIGGHGRKVIKLAPGFCLAPGSPANTTGTNIAIITFNAQLHSDITPGCCNNVAELTQYTSQSGGPNFVNGGFTPPFKDAASVCINPTLEKSVVATSEAHTAPQVSTTPQTPANTPQVAIGEIVRYHVDVEVPEGGTLTNVQLTDVLPAGMKYLNDNTQRVAFISNQPFTHPSFPVTFDIVGNSPASSSMLKPLPSLPNGVSPFVLNCGAPAIFTLGDIKNNDSDFDREYISLEFNALVCNVAANQNGTTLPNTSSLSVNGTQIASSNSINVMVVEPLLDVHKTYNPPNPVSPANFTLTLTNTGAADAFDVHLTDTLPAGLTLMMTPAPSVGVSPSGCAVPQLSVSGNTLTLDIPRLSNSSTCTVTLKFFVQGQFCGTNTAQVTYSSLTGGVNSNPAALVGTRPNPTDSVTACSMPNKEDCERIYTASAQASNTAGCQPCTNQVTQPPGMVAWWSLDEPNGASTVNDIAGFNNHGTPQPASPLGVAGAPASVPGAVAGAMNFDSNFQQSGPNVEVPDHLEINFNIGDFTIDGWVLVQKPPSTYVHPIIDKLAVNSAGTQGAGYALYLVSSFSTGARLQFVMGSGGSLANYLGPNAPSVPFGIWTHIAVTVNRTSGAVAFYVNGSQVNTTGVPMPGGSINNTLPLLIGESRLPGAGQAAITLDELELFKRVLTQSEIQSVVNATGLGKCKCWRASNEAISCNPNGTFHYTVTLTNLSSSFVSTVIFSPISNVTISPNSIVIPLLSPGNSTTVTVTIGGPGAVSGANICFLAGLTGVPPAPSCRAQHCLTLPACPSPACAPRPPNMVSFWPLNEQTGTTVIDVVGAHNGTTSANIGSDPISAPLPKVGNALYFANSKATVSGNPYNFGNGNFSIDAWVRGNLLLNSSMGIVDKLDTSTGLPTGFAFFVRNGTVQLLMGNGTSSPATFMSTGGLIYGTWQHVAVTVQRTGVGSPIGRFYLNGVPAGTFVLPPNNVNNSVPLLIGSYRLNGPCKSCEVALDEVEIFSDVLSPTDIMKIFSAGTSGKCP